MCSLKAPAMALPPAMVAVERRTLVVGQSLRTSTCFNPGVRALKAKIIHVVRPNQMRCGALGSQMNLFERLARVVKSYVDAILGSFEDPEKILEQAVTDMNSDLTRMRQATAQVLASRKRLENKYTATQEAADDWHDKARLALQKGDEALAREALKRRKALAENASSFKAQLDEQKSVVDNLLSNTELLESKIQEAKSKKDALKARAKSAKTSTKLNEVLENIDTSSALAAFERMEEKVLAMEYEADSLQQLTTDEIEAKFTLLESSSVNDDLESLKRELSDTSWTTKGELPPGRTSATKSEAAYPWPDELQKEVQRMILI